MVKGNISGAHLDLEDFELSLQPLPFIHLLVVFPLELLQPVV